jgi:hypothetical protein
MTTPSDREDLLKRDRVARGFVTAEDVARLAGVSRSADRFPTLEAAIDHLRFTREPHPDEWMKTPKPMLIDAARHAASWIRRIEHERRQTPKLVSSNT